MRPRLLRAVVELAFGLIGTVVIWLVATPGNRAGLSFLGGLVLVVAAFEFGAFNIRLAAAVSATIALTVAMVSFATTVIVLALVLVASDPHVVVGWAVATGLLGGTAIWLTGEIAAGWKPAQGRGETGP